ncbi:MAG TPA: zinc ABC transporter substrate-binding protein [Gaiellales bacterium]|nr:zinc ABC transporter substrate-binding protein [Gaiellales bacterium]
MSKTLAGYVVLAAVLAAGGVALAATGETEQPARNGRLPVVAAENAYGSIAAQIGGRQVALTSILNDPAADPHLFTADTTTGLSVARAALVIQNGAGYDSFVGKLESAAPSSGRVVVTVADALDVHGAGANPHLWYDLPRLDRIAGAIAAGLERADPRHRAAYRAGLRRFERRLAPLRREVAAIRARDGGAPVAYTEPVPGYLLAAAGLRNLTPGAFSRAIEDGSEPTAAAVADMTSLLAGHRVRALLVNTQAVSPITARIRSAAEAAGVPVVGVTETLPAGETFQAWQLRQARALARALNR